ncbi:MAG: hypothetical protein V4691_08550 [Pseudomonadota bacterium]
MFFTFHQLDGLNSKNGVLFYGKKDRQISESEFSTVLSHFAGADADNFYFDRQKLESLNSRVIDDELDREQRLRKVRMSPKDYNMIDPTSFVRSIIEKYDQTGDGKLNRTEYAKLLLES